MNSLYLHFITILFGLLSPLSLSLNSDGLSLLALKSAISSDPTGALHSWSDSSATPCRWFGVRCTDDHRVTAISLSNLSLTGYIPSVLGAIVSLSSLSLSHNNFSNTIPFSLFNATSLLSLDLSHNSLSGEIPTQISSLTNLTSLDLSSNFLNGTLPSELAQLTQLTGTLNLSYNRFSGEVPQEYGNFPVMLTLDLRHNNLTGKVPPVGSLLNQGPTAFAGNPNLCGFPLNTPCPEAQNPNIPTNSQNPQNPNPNPNFPISGDDAAERENLHKGSFSLPLISGAIAAVSGGALLISLWAARKKLGITEGKKGRNKEESKKVINEEEEGQNGKFVALDEGIGLELEDLLRASAYVVGKSRGGIVYKVVVTAAPAVSPVVVGVRRLSEGDDATWRLKEFEADVEAIGRVKHVNIVKLRAYYYSKNEKLLVTDYIGNGSLYAALHGGQSNNAPPLSWTSRLKIAQGVAKGLTHIHECSPRKYVHGALKSSKILLDEDLHPYISGFGLARLGPSSSKPTHNIPLGLNRSGLSPYLAPEARSGTKPSQKYDVYAFGIVLLEMLTGQVPDPGPENDGMGLEGLVRKVFREERPLSEIIDPGLLHEAHAKKQVLAVFHIALGCTEADPEVRPRMRTVCERLDDVKFM